MEFHRVLPLFLPVCNLTYKVKSVVLERLQTTWDRVTLYFVIYFVLKPTLKPTPLGRSTESGNDLIKHMMTNLMKQIKSIVHKGLVLILQVKTLYYKTGAFPQSFGISTPLLAVGTE